MGNVRVFSSLTIACPVVSLYKSITTRRNFPRIPKRLYIFCQIRNRGTRSKAPLKSRKAVYNLRFLPSRGPRAVHRAYSIASTRRNMQSEVERPERKPNWDWFNNTWLNILDDRIISYSFLRFERREIGR